jgi:hypothetical protein
MRRRSLLLQGGIVLLCALVGGCGDPADGPDQIAVPGKAGATKTSASGRAERRAYDGAPPVIPHDNLGIRCVQCHDHDGLFVPDLGYAPANPHLQTRGISIESNCRQCHVQQNSKTQFVANAFEGFPQDLRKGDRLHEFAPPVMPHRVFMREDCTSCHDGPAAREEIRCSHPERSNCRQCHVPAVTATVFGSDGG